jgi:hypothetical protein
MSPNPCQVEFLQASKDKIHHLLYHGKVQIDKVHEILCHHGPLWVKYALPLHAYGSIELISNREKQLKTTIKKWQSENPTEWPPIPKPKSGRSKPNPCKCHIHCDPKSGVCYSLYHIETIDNKNAHSEQQSLEIVLVPNSIQATGGSKIEYVYFTYLTSVYANQKRRHPFSSNMAPFQDVHTGIGRSRDRLHPSLSAYTSHHHLMSLHDSRMRSPSGLTMVSSMPQQATPHHHHDETRGDAFTICESNLSAQSISPPPNESNTHSLQPVDSYA